MLDNRTVDAITCSNKKTTFCGQKHVLSNKINFDIFGLSS